MGELILDNNYVFDTEMKAYFSNLDNAYQQSIYNTQNRNNKAESLRQEQIQNEIDYNDKSFNINSNVLRDMQNISNNLNNSTYPKDNNSLRYVGWDVTNKISNYDKFFSDQTIDIISKKITQHTMGVDCNNRPIVVPKDKIQHVMSQVLSSNRPKVGDIYGRYNVPDITPRNDLQEMIDRTINIIVNDIRVNIGMEQNNAKLSIWDTVYGDFNRQGLQQVPQGFAKIKKKRIQPMFFFENY